MKVGMYYSNNDVRVEDQPRPEIGDGELLVRVEASGICGSDVMEWYRKDRVPLVLGHEIAGEIVETGKSVKKYKKGQKVAVAHHVPCGECHLCKMGHETTCDTLRKTNFFPGGFSEYIRVPEINVEHGVFLLPDNLSYEEATFVEPLACIVRGQRLANMCKSLPAHAYRQAGGRQGKSVLVLGSGITGLLHIKLAKLNGASFIAATDIVDYRIKAAKKAGADIAFDAKGYKAEDFRKANNGLLADLVIVCTGALSGIKQATESVERGGTILFFAPTNKDVDVPIPFNKLFWRNEITLTSSYAGSPADHIEALELISRGKIDVKDLITHKLPLGKIQEGFKLVVEAKDSLKVIIEPQK